MRVALLAHLHHPIASPFVGGLEMHTSMVADELVERGHDVTLFARESSSTRARLQPILGEDAARSPMWEGHTRDLVVDEAIARAVTAVQAGDFDVVLNNSLNPLPYTELTEQPMLTVLHTPPLARINAVIESPAWRPGPRHAFVAVSRFTARAWRSRLPEVDTVPNGIYLDHWHTGAPRNPDLAVWSARITPEKGLHEAIDAARLAGMRMEFSGAIGDQAYWENEIRPRLGPDVLYRGHLDHRDLAGLIGRASVFLATPLWDEPFGLAMVEAMACGTPVAAFPNGACREVVLPGGGVVAANTSPIALAWAIERARLLDNAQVHAHAQRYDTKAMMNRYEDLLVHLAGLPASLPEVLSA
ncbi:glycosyltransferase [Kineosporia rhizophila]|uniref:glycosyltransferase n=1 Tax=Kineosporia rhizophila TaxID=84633 RepID=UPI001E3030B1|nr:glycosyltransferase [Kineosporia rhizophila]